MLNTAIQNPNPCPVRGQIQFSNCYNRVQFPAFNKHTILPVIQNPDPYPVRGQIQFLNYNNRVQFPTFQEFLKPLVT